MNIVISTESAAATGGVGASLVAVLRAGDAILLDGDLGAGKTVFTQGLARAAGIDEVVTSPTFTLVNRYPTTIGPDLLHADLYRLDDLRQIVDLGLPELLDDDAFALIEWGERAAGTIGDDYLQVTFFRDGDTRDGDTRDGDTRDGDTRDGDIRDGDIRDGDIRDGDIRDGDIRDGDIRDGDTGESGESQRRIELRPVGDRWSARWADVEAAILGASAVALGAAQVAGASGVSVSEART
jgi:tRNA threonylcarbamoyladenosine biosynthesis protein TsaE